MPGLDREQEQHCPDAELDRSDSTVPDFLLPVLNKPVFFLLV
jgi:hypothetical protein